MVTTAAALAMIVAAQVHALIGLLPGMTITASLQAAQ
jgi:hypothetical protein